MAKVKNVNEDKLPTRPMLTDEAKQNYLISLAIDLVEQRLKNGTASSQEVTHFLKLGTTQAKEDLERARLENELIKAKTESLQSTKRIEELYANALSAMQRYSGQASPEEGDGALDD